MEKPFNPKRIVSAGRIPRKRGLKPRDLVRLQKLQARDLGEEKAQRRIWELRNQPQFDALLYSLPKEFETLLRTLLKEKTSYLLSGINAIIKGDIEKLQPLLKRQNKKRLRAIANIALSRHFDSTVRWKAALILLNIEPHSSVQILQRTLHDKDGDMRRHAIWKLRDIGSPAAIKLIEKALKDKNRLVSDEAKKALEYIQSSKK